MPARRSLSAALVAVVALCLAPPVAARDDRDPFLLPAHLGLAASHGAFLHIADDVDDAAAVAAVRTTGVAVGAVLPAADAVWVTGSGAALARAAALPPVVGMTPAREVVAASETAGWATGARAIWEPTGGGDVRLTTDDGTTIDGTGVGIAVIDTGIDGTRPDLPADGPNPKVVRNYIVEGTTGALHERTDTDTGGHGTHVAGIAAGTGAASGGRFRGVAPGAKLYGFSVLRVNYGLSSDIAAALQWIYDHGHRMQPPIKVVNLSLGSGGAYNADEPMNRIVDALVADRGVTVVWAAMNNGGDGTTDNTNSAGKNPTPGVLMVANYDDADAAAIDGELSEGSSRGLAADPSTWPDVAAPGSVISAPCIPRQSTCLTWTSFAQPRHYSELSGTSMAAPHVAAVAALLYQAQPDITPAEIERLVEATARKISFGAPYADDPAHPGMRSSYDKGHGLLDAYAAVRSLVAAAPTTSAGPRTVLATDGEDASVSGAVDVLRLVLVEEADAVELRLRVRDLDDLRAPTLEYAIELAVHGRRHTLRHQFDGQAVRPVGAPPPLSAVRDGDEIVVRYDRAVLGAVRGAIAIDAAATARLLHLVSSRPEQYEENVDSAPPGRATGSLDGAASEEHVFAG